ncbi:TetR/AcrR family transcriptional regulator [Actinocorallia populi]|uniref:TetR/AcrR family transcriptional regulator n=1 Tax=Actinocorallia populi TaxID=2079200 RepID=UPI000D0897DF|nr:TetR/AcrR family transcriptional regulator [Actinocorallia populi]
MSATPPPSASPLSAIVRREAVLAPVGGPSRLRADAARNRTRLLEEAARLLEEGGVASITMEAVAAAAQVGKGTVSRRFGNRMGLLHALLDHHERRLQGAFISGPPPLGPGAPPVERLKAFGPAVLRHELDRHDLYAAINADLVHRYTGPVHGARFVHVALLLRQAGAGGDVELLGQTLLGYLDTVLVHHLLSERGMTLERLEDGWRDLVDRLTAPGRSPGPEAAPAEN